MENKKVVLVVDDSRTARYGVEIALRPEPVEVLQAESGLEALDILAAYSNISLVITDIHMPGMDGLALLREMEANPKTAHIPVIVLTTEIGPDMMERAKAYRCVRAWMVKPFHNNKLVELVHKVASAA